MSTSTSSTTQQGTTSSMMNTITTTSAISSPTGGGGGGGNNNQQSSGGSIATSASLYLYTFLATLVLLLSVSAAIVIRSFVLRRRHRRMVEEAIRNGTWVPPTPPNRPARVDLSKKPVLWEAYIDDKGGVAAAYESDGAGKGVLHKHWRAEHSRDWDTIKPFSAAYVTKTPEVGAGAAIAGGAAISANSSLSLPLNGVPAPTTGLVATPSATNLNALAVPANDASANVTMASTTNPTAPPPQSLPAPVTVHTPAPAPTPAPRTPRHRAFFSHALRMLNPTPDQTSPLPAPMTSTSSADLHSQSGADNIAMGELHRNSTGPSTMRVAVLIAMPTPPMSSSTDRSLSASSSSLPSSSSPPPNSLPAAQPPVATPAEDKDEHALPYLEVGVTEVLMVPPEMSTSSYARGKVRDSVGSTGSRDSGGSPV